MSEHASQHTPTTPKIDPATYGVSASQQALQQLVTAITERVTDQLTQDITTQLTEAITAQITDDVTAQVTAKVTRELDARYQHHLQALYEEMLLSRRRQFGPSSESASQARLFDEADVLAEQSSPADDTAGLPGQEDQAPADKKRQPPKARGKRAPLPADLPRVDIVHDVPQAERTCACGTPMVQIGEDISEQLDIIPMQVRVLRHIRKRYACPDKNSSPVTAPVAPQVIPRSNASGGFLAMLLTTKYVDGLPLARFEKTMARSGVAVPRQTLARWVIGAAKALQPLHNLLRDAALDSPVVHMDETTVQVLKEDGRAASSKSFMWVQVAGPPDKPVVLYDYDPSRSQEVPTRLLEGWQGYLMVDGYKGYNKIGRQQNVVLLNCMAHLRRKYIEAQRVKGKGKVGHADHAIALIAKLYKIERRMRDATDAQRCEARQTESVPILDALCAWHQKVAPTVPPSSTLGKALRYQGAYWPNLIRYVERGDLPIDNNRAENAIRPFVVGRKAWLFSDRPSGAHASAVIYSLIETAKANGMEPYTWLCRVLRRIPTAKTVDDYEALLPWNLNGLELASEING